MHMKQHKIKIKVTSDRFSLEKNIYVDGFWYSQEL